MPEVANQSSNDSALIQRAVRGAKEGDGEALHFLYVRFAPDLSAT